MKKFLYEVLIKEFKGMKPLHRFFCAYFCVSFVLVGALDVEHTSIWAAIALVINFAISALLIRRVPLKDNEETKEEETL